MSGRCLPSASFLLSITKRKENALVSKLWSDSGLITDASISTCTTPCSNAKICGAHVASLPKCSKGQVHMQIFIFLLPLWDRSQVAMSSAPTICTSQDLQCPRVL